MNDKLKRAIAIIALVLILVFTVTFILYLFDKTMLNGSIGELALWSGAFGLLFALVLWVSRAFPAQQVKDEQRARLYEEAEAAEEAARAEAESAEEADTAENAESEQVSEPQPENEETDNR